MAGIKPNTVQFTVRLEGYGALTIEAVAVLNPSGTVATSTAGLEPPSRNVVAGSAAAAQAPGPSSLYEPGTLTPSAKAFTASQPYTIWYDYVTRALRKLLALVDGNKGGGPLIQVTAWSIDETDAEWYGTGNIDGNTDPVTFTPTLTVNSSRYGNPVARVIMKNKGRQYTSAPEVVFSGDGVGAKAKAVLKGDQVDHVDMIEYGAGYSGVPGVTFSGGGGINAAALAQLYPFVPGCYVVWNDPTNQVHVYPGPLTRNVYSYEIDLITAVDYDTGAITIERADADNPGYAKLGSLIQPHTNVDGVDFYSLVPGQFTRAIGAEKGPCRWKLLWDNMCVVAVQARVLGSDNVTTQNLTPLILPVIGDIADTRRPGLRTMAGNAYIQLAFSGALAVGQNLDSRRIDAGQAHETIRVVVGKLTTKGTGDMTAKICYINPRGDVGLIDSIVITTGNYQNYVIGGGLPTGPPDIHQMPYHINWAGGGVFPHSLDWPPNRFLRVTDSLGVPLSLTPDQDLPGTIKTDPSLPGIPFEPNGDIAGVITAGGGASDLRVTVQT